MEKICENCKFWDTSEKQAIKNGEIGLCRKVKMFWDSTEWVKNDKEDDSDKDWYLRSLTEDCKNDKAFVQDGSDYKAELLSLKDFGCNQFEEKC